MLVGLETIVFVDETVESKDSLEHDDRSAVDRVMMTAFDTLRSILFESILFQFSVLPGFFAARHSWFAFMFSF